MTLPSLISAEIFVFLMIFARVGTIILLMPAIGENYIPVRIRLGLGLVFAIVLVPVVTLQTTSPPSSVAELMLILGGEVFIGLFLGLFMRILVSALTTAGILISFVAGFSSALMFNPLLQSQGVLHSAFITLSGLMMLFVLDLHHLFFIAMVDSYVLLPRLDMIGDMVDTMARLVNDSFAMGLKMTTPIIILIMLFYVVIGIASRLMPQLHIFFIGLPIQIALSFIVLAVTFLPMLLFYADYFAETMTQIML